MTSIKALLNKRSLFLAAVLVAAAAVGFGILYSVSKNSGSKAQTNCQGTCVALYADKASPDTVSIPVGTNVQFNSADGKTHDLSLGKDDGMQNNSDGKFSSGEFKADEGWRVKFTQEGSFYFRDRLNSKISILVVVYTPGKTYKLQAD